MLQLVDIGRQSLKSYAGIISPEIIEELKQLATQLQSLRVIHINATPYGGGVSELLRSLVPLENDLGLKSEWRIIFGNNDFFKITKAIHDGLQGGANMLTPAEQEAYLSNNFINSKEFNPKDYDIIVIHDPQPAAMLECLVPQGPAKWIWRCHIDTSEPNPDIWNYFKRFLPGYDAAIFTMDEFIPPDFPAIPLAVIPPAIDPLSPKNMDLPPGLASGILEWLGMFPGEPFITQVSRFDKWKDPFGVIQAYRMIKEEIPDIHLALVGSMALDDPDAWKLYSELEAEDIKDPDLHIFTNLTGVSNIEVNSFQRLAKVVIQKSIREGFGLVVSEALWKETPVVAGRAGGIPLQLSSGGGFLVDSVAECAKQVIKLIKDRENAGKISLAGRKNVTNNFLMPRLIKDELRLFQSLLSGRLAA